MASINKGRVKRFVGGFFGHEQASIKFVTNPNSVRNKFQSVWRTNPEKVFGWSYPRKDNLSWRKALAFINKTHPNNPKKKRTTAELEWTATHEVAHIYAERARKVSQEMHEIFAELVALEYMHEVYPKHRNKIIELALSKKTKNQLILTIPLEVTMLHKYLSPDVRKRVIQDIADGKIKRSGKEFGKYIQSIVMKQKQPNKKYLEFLQNSINIPF